MGNWNQFYSINILEIIYLVKMARRNVDGIGDALVSLLFFVIAIVLLILAVFTALGIATLALGVSFSLNFIYLILGDNLDTAQLWTFSIILSLLLFVLFYFKCNKNLKKTAIYYLAFNFLILCIDVVAVYGFHNTFPQKLLAKITDTAYQKDRPSVSVEKPSQETVATTKMIAQTQKQGMSIDATSAPDNLGSDQSQNQAEKITGIISDETLNELASNNPSNISDGNISEVNQLKTIVATKADNILIVKGIYVGMPFNEAYYEAQKISPNVRIDWSKWFINDGSNKVYKGETTEENVQDLEYIPLKTIKFKHKIGQINGDDYYNLHEYNFETQPCNIFVLINNKIIADIKINDGQVIAFAFDCSIFNACEMTLENYTKSIIDNYAIPEFNVDAGGDGYIYESHNGYKIRITSKKLFAVIKTASSY